jgi:hypothetical protein
MKLPHQLNFWYRQLQSRYQKLKNQVQALLDSGTYAQLPLKQRRHLLQRLHQWATRLRVSLKLAIGGSVLVLGLALVQPAQGQIFVQKTDTDNPFNGFDAGNSAQPEFGDLDGDGDFDAVIGEYFGTFRYFKNTGSSTTPVFTEQTGTDNPLNGISAPNRPHPALADIDADGDLDLFIGLRNTGGIRYFRNTGSSTSPTFTEQTGANNPFNGVSVGFLAAPEFADLDADGDLDAFIGEEDGIINYYKNTGTSASPAFTVQTGTDNPLNGVDVGSGSKPALGDVDNDGDFDLVIGLSGTTQYYRNTGTSSSPVFTELTGSSNPLNFSIIGNPDLVDTNGDNALDFFHGVGNSPGFGQLLYFEQVREINIQGNNTTITDGDATPSATDHTDFGSVNVGQSLVRTFTIQNLGIPTITISSITSNNAKFVISGAPTSVGANGSATFTVTYTSTDGGVDNAVITVNNNDANEGVYDFAVRGNTYNALHFDGSNDFVNAGDINELDGASVFTIEAWVNFNSLGSFRSILSKRVSHTNKIQLSLGTITNQRLMFQVGNGPRLMEIQTLNDVIITNTWVHVAAVYNSAGITNADKMKIYINGVLQAVNYNGTVPNTTNASNNIPVVIGAENTSGAVPMNGAMAEMRIWTTARTCSQILAVKNRRLTGTETGLLAYYRFNQGVAGGTNTGVTTLNDAAGAPQNGTLVNFALNGATSNWIDGTASGITTTTPLPQPEINLRGNNINIVAGDTDPSNSDHTSFGTVSVGSSLVRTFTIQNLGAAVLSLSGISSNNAKFVVGSVPLNISPNSSQNITVTYTPTNLSGDNATITISNADCDEGNYTFALKGNLNSDFYVSATGSDANNGTSIATPKATIANALSIVPENSTINIAAGIYNETPTVTKTVTFVTTGTVRVQRITMNGSGRTLTLVNPLQVSQVVALQAGNVASDGNLILYSDATGTALIDNFTGGYTGTMTGNIRTQRYVPNANPGYRYFGIPVGGTTAGQFNNYQVLAYDESIVTNNMNTGWKPILSSTVLNSLSGYSVLSTVTTPVTYTLTGTANTGIYDVNISRQAPVGTTNPSAGFNAIGNPYPSPITWTGLLSLNPGLTTGTAFLFKTTGLNTGQWASINSSGVGTNGATNNIPSMQGFMIRMAFVGNTNFTINNSIRSNVFANNGNYLRETVHPLVRLQLSNGTYADEAVLYAEWDATPEIDLGLDTEKLVGESDKPSLSLLNNGQDMSIVALKGLQAGLSVPLSVEAAGTFSLRVIEQSQLNEVVYLYDRQTQTLHDLSKPYTFTSTGGVERNRFVLQIGEGGAGMVRVWASRQSVYIDFLQAKNLAGASLEILNLQGQSVWRGDRFQALQSEVKPQLAKGIYIVRVQSAAGVITKKVVLE